MDRMHYFDSDAYCYGPDNDAQTQTKVLKSLQRVWLHFMGHNHLANFFIDLSDILRYTTLMQSFFL